MTTAEQYPIKERTDEAAYIARLFISTLFNSRAAGEVMDDEEEGVCVVPDTEATRKTNREAMENAINRLRKAREDCAAPEDDIELAQDN